jgi:hypothetical protein
MPSISAILGIHAFLNVLTGILKSLAGKRDFIKQK